MSGLVRRLAWRVFPPPEVKATRAYMRQFLRRISPTFPLPRELERRAIALTNDAEHVVELIRHQRLAPEQVALVMLSSTAVGLLMSGRFHIYRGVLTGEGHALTSAFTRCISEMQQRGYQSEEKTQEALQRWRNEVQGLG